MKPVTTPATNLVYKGPNPEIGDLPCQRVRDGEIHASFQLQDAERDWIAAGAVVELGILCEPIPPISLNVGASPCPGGCGKAMGLVEETREEHRQARAWVFACSACGVDAAGLPFPGY